MTEGTEVPADGAEQISTAENLIRENRPPLTSSEQIAAAESARIAWAEEPEFARTDHFENDNARIILQELVSGKRSLDEVAGAFSGRMAEARVAADKDELTGLYTRGAGMRRMEEVMLLDKRLGLPTSAMMIDLDDFKTANEPGHLTGDTALEAAGMHILTEVRGSDVALRYGGDELMVVMPETGLAGALTVAKKVHENAAQTISEVAEEKGFPLPQAITFSAGVAEHRLPDENRKIPIADSVMSLTGLADDAAALAKFLGKNRIVSAQAMDDQAIFTDLTDGELYTVEKDDKGKIIKANKVKRVNNG